MFSSGDDGVGGGDCTTNDGTNTVQFQPAFPASCAFSTTFSKDSHINTLILGPFVTTVGGAIRTSPEVAVDFSGGGFSNFFARPSYQDDAVSTFLTGLGDTFQGLFKYVLQTGFP